MKKYLKTILYHRWFWFVARGISIAVAVHAAFHHKELLAIAGVASTVGCNDGVRDWS